MNNIPKIYTILPNNIKIEYTVILTFTMNNINYVVYTDNTYDKSSKLKLFVAKYTKTSNELKIEEPATKEEWTEITKIINSVIPPK